MGRKGGWEGRVWGCSALEFRRSWPKKQYNVESSKSKQLRKQSWTHPQTVKVIIV